MKARAAIIGLFGFGVLGFGQQTCLAQDFLPNPFRLDNSALFRNSSVPTFFPMASTLGSASVGWTSLARAETLDAPSPVTTAAPVRTSFLDRLTSAVPKADYVTGEVGFLYGAGAGKVRGDFKESYIIGEVGNEHLHISVGAAYQDSNFRLPRGR